MKRFFILTTFLLLWPSRLLLK